LIQKKFKVNLYEVEVKLHMKNKVFKVSTKIMAVTMILFMMELASLSGCSEKKIVERGDLPYYNVMNPIVFIQKPSLERIYQYAGAAVLVSYVDGPRFFIKDIPLEPGSGEEAIFLKTGVKPTASRQEFTVKIMQVLDDSDYNLKVDDEIKIRCNADNMSYNPYNLLIGKNPEQKFVIALLKSTHEDDKDCYEYSDLMQYYEKDGAVFSASKEGDMDEYSGMTVDEFANVLKKIEKVDPYSVS
jgi:hypothetical protein